MNACSGLTELRAKARQLTSDPGVYLMKDSAGNVIYVGKAKNLRNRVSSYFISIETADIKKRKLVDEIATFDVIVYNTELEALLAERTLIKHRRPRYNILLQDDKEYPFIRVNLKDEWPRFNKVRRIKDDGAKYIGPFGSGHSLNLALQLMFKVLPLIRCSQHEFKTAKRPCNYYHMKQCLGPCTLPVDRKEYLDLVQRGIALLSGHNRKVLQDLRKEMAQAAERDAFEQAALLRDQIRALERIEERQALVSADVAEADIIGVVKLGDEVAVHVAMLRGSAVAGGENFFFIVPLEQEDYLSDFLIQYYDNKYVPDLIILPAEPQDAENLLAALSLQEGGVRKKVRFSYSTSGQEAQLLSIAQKNAAYALETKHAHKETARIELEVLRDSLHLGRFPRQIECMDISNLQGVGIVASKVCFVDNRPAKDLYRRYELKTVTDGPDDFESMREVVRRRLEQGLRDNDLPDLLIIDGGRGQLSSALGVADSLGLDHMCIVGLAKKKLQRSRLRFRDQDLQYKEERVYQRGSETPIILVPGSVPHRVMTRIRDEAHRFAITYHRKKRSKKSFASRLDEIKGLGPVLKKRLLVAFGSLKAMNELSVEQLQAVKGVSEKLATEIFTSLHE